MANTDDHIQIISSSPTGATIATDYHSGTQRHWQVVKINTGTDGTDALLSNSNAIPVTYQTIDGAPFVPIAGNTAGTTSAKVYVEGGAVSADIGAVTFNVGGVEIEGGTLEYIGELGGGTLDSVTTIDAVTAVTTVTTVTNPVSVTGDVMLLPSSNAVGTVGVDSVTIPVRPQHGIARPGPSAVVALGNAAAWTSGVRVTNLGPNDVYVGNFDGASAVTVLNGYKLANLDSIFLEVSGITAVGLISAAGVSSDVRYIGS